MENELYDEVKKFLEDNDIEVIKMNAPIDIGKDGEKISAYSYKFPDDWKEDMKGTIIGVSKLIYLYQAGYRQDGDLNNPDRGPIFIRMAADKIKVNYK
jgi:hypothetical protein